MSVYLDASLLVSALVEEARTGDVRNWLKRVEDVLILSDFAAMEVAAALSRGVRTGRLSVEQANAALADLDALRALTENWTPQRATFALALEMIRDFPLKLAAPDALHLASAATAGAALASFDDRLLNAARARGVEVAQIGEAREL